MSEEWESDPRFRGTKHKTIHLFGVDYLQKEYLKEFLPLVHKHFQETNKNNELSDIKLNLLQSQLIHISEFLMN